MSVCFWSVKVQKREGDKLDWKWFLVGSFLLWAPPIGIKNYWHREICKITAHIIFIEKFKTSNVIFLVTDNFSHFEPKLIYLRSMSKLPSTKQTNLRCFYQHFSSEFNKYEIFQNRLRWITSLRNSLNFNNEWISINGCVSSRKQNFSNSNIPLWWYLPFE